MKTTVRLLALLGSMLVVEFSALCAQCTKPPDTLTVTIATYAARKFHVDPTVVRVTSILPFAASCFWEYQLTASSDRVLTLYLSPDFRFLTPALYDLNTDPRQDELLEQKKISRQVLDGRQAASINGAEMSLTVVVFSDFQCPFCRALSANLEALRVKGRLKDVEVVFRNYPLPTHDWAENAALIGECVRHDGPQSFGKFERYIFDNQAELDSTNVLEMSSDYINQEGLLKEDLKTCVTDPKTSADVKQDVQIGRMVGVRSTPTFFVNGVRYEGSRSQEQLEQILRDGRIASVQGSLPAAKLAK